MLPSTCITHSFSFLRYYHDPIHNITVSFLNFFGVHTPMQYYEMYGLYAPSCDSSGPSSAFSHVPSCPAFSCILNEDRKTGNNTCPGAPLVSKPPMDTHGGLYSMVQMLQPDTVIVNSGLWSNFTDKLSETLANLLDEFQKNGTVLIWKTTTATKLATGNFYIFLQIPNTSKNINTNRLLSRCS